MKLSARAILVLGWLGLVGYAYPGFMSFDSVKQLLQARAWQLTDDHPPLMSALWRVLELVVAGPFGMLIVQVTCFLVGAYLLLARVLSPRVAALCASLLLWFPPVAAVMAVIWKDAQMTGFLLLGAALLLSDARRTRLVGLGVLVLATGMRHNAPILTLPIIVLLFTWAPSRWRYMHAVAAWIAVTAVSLAMASVLVTTSKRHVWHESLALADMVGTLRYADELTDAELAPVLAGTPLAVEHDIQRATRSTFSSADLDPQRVSSFGAGTYIPALWVTTAHVFRVPSTADERAAISRAWRAIVLGHPRAYLTYRWHVFDELIGFSSDIPSAAYVWFTDVLDPYGSAVALEHGARESGVQHILRAGMLALGDSWLFRPLVYLVLAVLLAAFVRQRLTLALLASGVISEAALFVLAPTVDYRYSFWLVTTTLLVALLIAVPRFTTRGASSRT